jgi:hypothetical protein
MSFLVLLVQSDAPHDLSFDYGLFDYHQNEIFVAKS